MPNAKPDADFSKLMDGEAGEQNFREGVIKAWFEKATADKKALAKESLRQLQDKADYFVPSVSDPVTGYWGKPKDAKALVRGRFLRLHAYTWDSRFESVQAWNLWEHLPALDKVINVASGLDDPATAECRLPLLHEHIRIKEPEEFYQRVEVFHPSVKSFRFYKNGRFEIEFKTEDQAARVAELLLGKSENLEVPAH